MGKIDAMAQGRKGAEKWGMTGWMVGTAMVLAAVWIPAFAGMTVVGRQGMAVVEIGNNGVKPGTAG